MTLISCVPGSTAKTLGLLVPKTEQFLQAAQADIRASTTSLQLIKFRYGQFNVLVALLFEQFHFFIININYIFIFLNIYFI